MSIKTLPTSLSQIACCLINFIQIMLVKWGFREKVSALINKISKQFIFKISPEWRKYFTKIKYLRIILTYFNRFLFSSVKVWKTNNSENENCFQNKYQTHVFVTFE